MEDTILGVQLGSMYSVPLTTKECEIHLLSLLSACCYNWNIRYPRHFGFSLILFHGLEHGVDVTVDLGTNFLCSPIVTGEIRDLRVTLLGECPDDGRADESGGTNEKNTHDLVAWFYIGLAMLKMEGRDVV
jgi:hypothetical protein